VDIAASPEEVWAVLADLGSYGQWNPFIQSRFRPARRRRKAHPAAGPVPG